MTKRRCLFLSLVAGAALAAPPSIYGQAQIIFDDFLFDNGSMPGDNLDGPNNPMGFLEWDVTDGSIDLVGPAATDPDAGPELLTARFVDLGGSTGDPGLFSYALPIALEPNIPYTLSFMYNSVDGLEHTARINLVGQTFELTTSSTEFQLFSDEFVFPEAFTSTGSSPSPLTFQDLGTGNSGVGVDRIMLNQTVPEPTSALLLAGGALALAAVRRKGGAAQ